MTTHGRTTSLILTPPGPGAIGVVRVLGPSAHAIVSDLFRPANGRPLSDTNCDSVRYGWLVADGERIDEVLVSWIPASEPPAIDLNVHGGVRVLERVAATLEERGAPLREANCDGISLWPAADRIEGEAVEALSRAKTERAACFLAWQRTHLPVALDHAAELCTTDPPGALARLDRMLARSSAAQALIEGVTVAIIGPANSGKSTLFNALAGRSAAMVSQHAGTTRDWITQSIEMHGVPVTLVDTASVFPEAERLVQGSIQAGRDQAVQADAALVVLDSSVPLTRTCLGLLHNDYAIRRRLIVANKADLTPASVGSVFHLGHSYGDVPVIRTSAKTGEGVDRLVEGILSALGFSGFRDLMPCFFTPRQVMLARQAVAALSDGQEDASAAQRSIRWGILGGQADDTANRVATI